MAITNQERVGKAMDLLRQGLAPYVEREIQQAVKAGGLKMDAVRRFAEDPMLGQKPIARWDAAGLLKLLRETWNDVFARTLGRAERARSCRRCATGATSGRTRSLSRATMRTARSNSGGRPAACARPRRSTRSRRR